MNVSYNYFRILENFPLKTWISFKPFNKKYLNIKKKKKTVNNFV